MKETRQREEEEVKKYCDLFSIEFPHAYEYLYRVKNDTRGAGVKKGVPDLFCLYPQALHSDGKIEFKIGFAVEMKAPSGRLSKEQVVWKNKLESVGCLVFWAWSAEEAMEQTRSYFARK